MKSSALFTRIRQMGFIVGMWVVFFGSASAGAQVTSPQDSRAISGGESRTLNGHHFISPLYFLSPFTNGSFSFSQGFGVYQFDFVGVLTGEDKQSTIFLYNQRLGAEIGILNQATINVFAMGNAAMAGDLEDILAIGGITDFGAGGGVKVRIATLEDIGMQFALATNVGYSRTLNIQPIALLNQTIDSLIGGQSDLVESQLIVTSDSLSIDPVFTAAFGTGPFGAQVGIGFPVFLGLGSGGDTSYGLSPGLHLAFDLGHYSEFSPIALTFEYQLVETLSDDGGTQHNIAGGFYYSGRRDLSVGLTAGGNFMEDLRLIFGTINLQYYF
ncbi:MAG: hypothetical protein HUU55_02655 [Myxococcales bacterium]|nr:hypothetical protein [Myxococcales bacterium]